MPAKIRLQLQQVMDNFKGHATLLHLCLLLLNSFDNQFLTKAECSKLGAAENCMRAVPQHGSGDAAHYLWVPAELPGVRPIVDCT